MASAGVYYRVNDLVTFGNVVYRVTTAHTSEGTFIDEDESCRNM